MTYEFDDILYKDSPFVPIITPKAIGVANESIRSNTEPLIVSISAAFFSIEDKIRETLNKELNWILDSFDTSLEDLNLYVAGYLMIPQLIIGSTFVLSSSYRDTVRTVFCKSNNIVIDQVNRYQAANLGKLYYIYLQNWQNPMACVDAFLRFCLVEPFSQSRYYQAGLVASQISYLQILSHPGLLRD